MFKENLVSFLLIFGLKLDKAWLFIKKYFFQRVYENKFMRFKKILNLDSPIYF